MKRGEFYRVYRASKEDAKAYRVYLIVSRQDFIKTPFSTVICAPVYSRYHDLSTQVEVGTDEGLKHESAIYCDDLVSINKSRLTDCMRRVHTPQLCCGIKGMNPETNTLPKQHTVELCSAVVDYVSTLSDVKMEEVNKAIRVALATG
jgi:mRNA interferase MazF